MNELTKGKKVKMELLERQYPMVSIPREVVEKMDIKDMQGIVKSLKNLKEEERTDALRRMQEMSQEQLKVYNKNLQQREYIQLDKERVRQFQALSQKKQDNKEKMLLEKEIILKKEEPMQIIDERTLREREERESQKKLQQKEKMMQREKKEIEMYLDKREQEERTRNEKHLEVKHEKVVGLAVATEIGAVAITMAEEIENGSLLGEVQEDVCETQNIVVDMTTSVTKTYDQEGNIEIDTHIPTFEDRVKKAREQYEINKTNAPGYEQTTERTREYDEGFERERTTEMWG